MNFTDICRKMVRRTLRIKMKIRASSNRLTELPYPKLNDS